MNYNMSASHCQLGTGVCIRMISDDTTELINFGSTEHLAGVQLIQANQYHGGMGAFAADTSGGKVAVLLNDEYYIPGSFKIASNTFKAPLEKADASGREIIQSTNLAEIFLIVPKDGYEFFYLNFFTGTPGGVVHEKAVLGGYQKMADGKIAKLYSINSGGNFVSYNSVTGNGYMESSASPVDPKFHNQLMSWQKA